MSKKYIDNESRRIITEYELEQYFKKNHKDSSASNFKEYIENCTSKNGSLRELGGEPEDDGLLRMYEHAEKIHEEYEADCKANGYHEGTTASYGYVCQMQLLEKLLWECFGVDWGFSRYI